MTCRIRAGEVARPHECGFTPRAARPGAFRGRRPYRRPVMLGSSTPADPLLSTGHPGGGRTRRPPGSPRRCGGVLSSVRDLDALTSEIPNGTGDLCCYSPLTRSGGSRSVRPGGAAAGAPRTSGGAALRAGGARASRKPEGPGERRVRTPKGRTPFGPDRPRSGHPARRSGRAPRQLPPDGGGVTPRHAAPPTGAGRPDVTDDVPAAPGQVQAKGLSRSNPEQRTLIITGLT